MQCEVLALAFLYEIVIEQLNCNMIRHNFTFVFLIEQPTRYSTLATHQSLYNPSRLNIFIICLAHDHCALPNILRFTFLEVFSSLYERVMIHFFLRNQNNTRHVLHHLLQETSHASSGYSLRDRVHNFVLPNNINSLSDHNFLNRILYKDIF